LLTPARLCYDATDTRQAIGVLSGKDLRATRAGSGWALFAMKEVEIQNLKPLETPAHTKPRPNLQKLTDDELLRAVRTPKQGDYLTENTRTGSLHDGNGRAHELQRRAADPNSTITPDMKVPVKEYTPDLSMFPDLD
jgi:hypothetical protein